MPTGYQNFSKPFDVHYIHAFVASNAVFTEPHHIYCNLACKNLRYYNKIIFYRKYLQFRKIDMEPRVKNYFVSGIVERTKNT